MRSKQNLKDHSVYGLHEFAQSNMFILCFYKFKQYTHRAIIRKY